MFWETEAVFLKSACVGELLCCSFDYWTVVVVVNGVGGSICSGFRLRLCLNLICWCLVSEFEWRRELRLFLHLRC